MTHSPTLPDSLLEWFRSIPVDIPPELSESGCRELAEPADPSEYEHLEKVSRLVVHHTATETGNAAAIRCLHRCVFGWTDIGYHFVIGNGTLSRDGELEKGRPEWAVGAHARKNNQDSLGICLVGDFEKGRPTAAQLESLEELLRAKMSKYSLGTGSIYLHREIRECDTVCPGSNLTRDMILGMC